ncbi:hypothetical protein CERSUDRAFT_95661 [Gelatoporia subvermispora B]|uniref:DUF6534 domain-containing protein n=1 Tax=Ceriporiopsis subvermispora (strain B) TaxID=914234 RepID=M2QH11_CERS8|nr:hypothetical protein CERSUDRAFT_95661 [Gelatoporia subvermispora B]
MYHYMIIEYGNPLSIVIPLWSFSAAVIVSGILAFCEFVTTIVFIALGIAQKSFNANGTINGVFYAGAGSAAAADIILASSLAIILWRRQTGFQKTDTVLKTLIIYSINTCALTCLVSITSIITFASLQSSPSLVYVAFYHQLPTLLFNALLATYNSRQDLRNAVVAKGEAVNIPLCDVSIRPRGVSYYASCGSDSRGIHISVDKSQSTKVDTCATFGSIETSTNRQSDGFNHEKD